jgi:hypothetical protein
MAAPPFGKEIVEGLMLMVAQFESFDEGETYIFRVSVLP